MIDRGLESDHEDSFVFLMSSVAQLEAEIYIGRGVFLKKYINPVFF